MGDAEMTEPGDPAETRICRLCLSATSDCYSLVEDFEAVTMLEALTTLRIPPNDEISTVMCLQCNNDLRLAFSIQQNFLKAERRFFQQRVTNDTLEAAENPFQQRAKNDENDTFEAAAENPTSEPDESENLSDLEDSPESETINIEIVDEGPTTDEKFICDLCGAIRTSKTTLKLHIYRCHNRTKCTVCDKTMSTVKIKNHMEIHKNRREIEDVSSPPEDFACKICGKTKFSKEALTRHINGIHTTKSCPICHKEMARASLPRHIETHTSRSPTSQNYVCDICGKTKRTREALYRHRTDVHTKRTCPVCGKELARGSMRNHVELHKKTPEMASEEAEYKCDVCGTVKLTKASYYKHKYDHVQAECHICGVVMGQTSLQKHIKRHNKTYTICDLCGKSVDSSGLKSHVEHSHRDNAYKCEHCDAVYRQKQTLADHEKKEHLGGADFACDTCGKKFYKKISLRRHVECTHLKLKPYACEVCSMAFYTSSQRTKHARIHTDERPYKCGICEVQFRKKATLRKHLQDKHDVEEELAFACDACGKRFASKVGLQVHNRKVCS